MFHKRALFAVGLTAAALVSFVLIGVRHYDYDVSALFHMDRAFGERHAVPAGLVLYEDAGYDGMLYYQVARDIPALFSGGKTSLDSPYRFQRILLPLLVYAVTLGQEQFFPYALLLINLFAALATLAVTILITKKVNVHTLTSVFNPAILVGILYSLTEPLSVLFIVLFLFLWERAQRRVTTGGLVMLLLSLLARETTVFLIGLLLLWSLWKRQWRQAFLLLVPVLLFALWQWFLVLRLGSLPFRTGGGVIVWPLQGPLAVLTWALQESGMKLLYRLSGVSLLGFVTLLCITLGREWIQKKVRVDVLTFLLTGLSITMLSMDPHMWGAITSIGRVVTPLYPVYALYAAERDTWLERVLSVVLIVVSVVAAVGIASVPHPYVLS